MSLEEKASQPETTATVTTAALETAKQTLAAEGKDVVERKLVGRNFSLPFLE